MAPDASTEEGDVSLSGESLTVVSYMLGYMLVRTIHWTGDVVPAGDISPTFDHGIVCVDPFGGDVCMSHCLT